MSAPPPVAVRATDLVKTYRAGRAGEPVRALDRFCLEVGSGSVLALLGPNGAGKTTAVKVLATLARPDAGRAEVAGLDVAGAPEQVRRRIGLVAQRPSADPRSTGRENLVLAGRIQGLNRLDAHRRAGELLERFDLAPAADRLARTYSGGMSRRLDVALGLVHRPRVLFLDEPTTGLDPESRAGMWTEIDRLAGDERITVLLTTHYLDEADRLADQVAIVAHGRVVVTGTPERLKSELRGDGIRLCFDGSAQAAAAAGAVSALPGVREPVAEGSTLHARCDDGASALPGVLAALDRAGVRPLSVTVARPTLDDVYRRHVGRSLGEAA